MIYEKDYRLNSREYDNLITRQFPNHCEALAGSTGIVDSDEARPPNRFIFSQMLRQFWLLGTKPCRPSAMIIEQKNELRQTKIHCDILNVNAFQIPSKWYQCYSVNPRAAGVFHYLPLARGG